MLKIYIGNIGELMPEEIYNRAYQIITEERKDKVNHYLHLKEKIKEY